jgi:hypothetical protein
MFEGVDTMDKRFVAIAACASLLTCEFEMDKFDVRHTVTDLRHNHVEMPTGIFVDVRSPFSASGGQSEKERYHLQLAPAYATDKEGNQQLVGYHAYGIPEAGTQRMYAKFDTLDSALCALESEWGRKQPQLDATRRSLLNGKPTEIGGRAWRLLLPAESMRRLGLVFGYPES